MNDDLAEKSSPLPEEPATLDFEVIREAVNNLIEFVLNRLRTEWPTRYNNVPNAPIILQLTVFVARNTYNTIRYFSAQEPEDPLRKPEFCLSVPPLARTILDSVFTVIFLFQDLSANTKWFVDSGWYDLDDLHERYVRDYGSDEKWHDFIQGHRIHLDDLKTQYGVGARPAVFFPTPGKIKNRMRASSLEIFSFLSYLDDWYYKELSEDSHARFGGLIRRGGSFLNPDADQVASFLEKYRSNAFKTTLTLLLSLLSEIQIGIGYTDLGNRLKYVWGILSGYFDDSKEVYEKRYQSML